MRTNASGSGQPAKPFWTGKRRKAAALVAEDFYTDREIAKMVKIDLATLERWKLVPEFKAYVQELVGRLATVAERFVIGRRARRVADLDENYAKLKDVIKARSADPTHKKAPGGETGLLVRTEKVIGSGDHAEKVEEFAVDLGLLKEMRETQKQAAQELGQWVEKSTLGGSLIIQSVEGINEDEVLGIAATDDDPV